MADANDPYSPGTSQQQQPRDSCSECSPGRPRIIGTHDPVGKITFYRPKNSIEDADTDSVDPGCIGKKLALKRGYLVKTEDNPSPHILFRNTYKTKYSRELIVYSKFKPRTTTPETSDNTGDNMKRSLPPSIQPPSMIIHKRSRPSESDRAFFIHGNTISVGSQMNAEENRYFEERVQNMLSAMAAGKTENPGYTSIWTPD